VVLNRKQRRMALRWVLRLKTVFLCLVAVFFTEIAAHLVLQAQVDSQMGFKYATPYEGRDEVFVITNVVPGKLMHSAGLRAGDYVRFYSVDNLYHLLVFNQEKMVSIPIQRDQRAIGIQVGVPKLKLLIPPRWLWWTILEGDRVYEASSRQSPRAARCGFRSKAITEFATHRSLSSDSIAHFGVDQPQGQVRFSP
jgi:hypothetical protein